MPHCHHSSAQSWTLASIIGSYLDLALAYLFLIGSTLVFLASKFLSLFGLALPCPCAGGLFGRPDCVQTILLDSARTRIESLRTSIRSRFPFDAIFNEHVGSESDRTPLRLTGPEGVGDGDDRVVVGNRVGSVVGRRFRRRMVSGWRKGKSSVSPPITLSSQGAGIGDNFTCQSEEENSVGVLRPEDGQRTAEDGVYMVGQSPAATEFFSVENMSSATRDVQPSNVSMDLIIQNLERELEEAHAAYAALYLELEKERSAAATAADEAMAMILRLQSEKAAVKMESWQYQRMIEEKSAYDDEEMEILKEIIMRREHEKHALEKEVEAYRLMLYGDVTGGKPDSLFDPSDDPTLMLKTICDSIRKKENSKSKMQWEDDRRIHYSDPPSTGGECNIEFQEKGVVTITMDAYPSGHCQSSSLGDIGCTLHRTHELGFYNDSSCPSGEQDVGTENKVEMRIPVDELDREDDRDAEQRDSYPSQFEAESSILDVHVIEDSNTLDDKDTRKESNMFNVAHASEISEKDGTADELHGTSSVERSTVTPATNRVEWENEIQRSCSYTTKGFKPMDTLSDNATHVDLRRSSMSAVDSERFKLETEVETLRKRLKTIQQGRENLSFPMEYRENETFQLQILDEIACQLQEIRRITDPGKSMRQSSLPPLSSKVNSKKRRCRSVSWGLNDSA